MDAAKAKKYLEILFSHDERYICVNELFEEPFDEFTNNWFPSLPIQNYSNLNLKKIKFYLHKIKIRYECDCDNSWTSAKSLMIIYCYASMRKKYYDIFVINQQCKRCSNWPSNCHIYAE